MEVTKKHKFLIGLILVTVLIGSTLFICQTQKCQSETYINCVAGLLSNNKDGSSFVIYNTKTWKPAVLMNLPEVSPDNYGAISADGNYIAYTRWDEYYARRYVEVYTVPDGKTRIFFQDLPAKTEIIKISWLPDNKTLLFIRNEAPFYQEIQTLNVETGEQSTLVKGELWQVRSIENSGTTAKDFYLKGHDAYLKVKEKNPPEIHDPEHPINYDVEWNYYLDQNDINDIYRYYGGTGTFAIANVPGMMYVDFSPPKCSNDGKKIIYSATLRRNSAPGIATPLWMCSAIWEYDMKTGKNAIVYKQTDTAAIGRVDWIDTNRITFISYYDWQGSRDSVNYLDLSTNQYRIIFPYSDENYNNVTLLPVGDQRITFTTSPKNDYYINSSTILYDIDSHSFRKLDVKLGEDNVLLENFIFTGLSCKNFTKLGIGDE